MRILNLYIETNSVENDDDGWGYRSEVCLGYTVLCRGGVFVDKYQAEEDAEEVFVGRLRALLSSE